MIDTSIPVVILAGGLGTRLREETEYRPKPMVKIGQQPILWHIMKTYAHYGFKDFIVCLGYRGEVIREYFLDYSVFTGDIQFDLARGTSRTLSKSPEQVDWRVTLADTGQPTMTGGRIRRIREYVKSDRFMVTYGDGVANIDIPGLLETHTRAGRLATLTGVRPTSRFGELTIEGDRVARFAEKEFLQEVWISGGFFVFEKKIFDYLKDDATVLEQEPLRRLSAEGQLTVFKHDGFWQCMDTYREFEMLNRLWESPNPPWKVW
ncbi:MAG TPA: glucose-1-phosphate cytidylyltransferase [bacterium]|nr:glucose-1-phosphate cytidylyltransferase [bacterium]